MIPPTAGYYAFRYNRPAVSPQPREPFASLGRFSEVGFHILVALAEGPKHGYAMMQDIGGMTGARPGPGTLYAAIARLEQRRWIEPVASDDRRRPYRLTNAGRQALRARLEAQASVARVARTRLAHG
jgi:DNA-binding PadR family transcriptional regulator